MAWELPFNYNNKSNLLKCDIFLVLTIGRNNNMCSTITSSHTPFPVYIQLKITTILGDSFVNHLVMGSLPH